MDALSALEGVPRVVLNLLLCSMGTGVPGALGLTKILWIDDVRVRCADEDLFNDVGVVDLFGVLGGSEIDGIGFATTI